jgi:hypothetical protein
MPAPGLLLMLIFTAGTGGWDLLFDNFNLFFAALFFAALRELRVGKRNSGTRSPSNTPVFLLPIVIDRFGGRAESTGKASKPPDCCVLERRALDRHFYTVFNAGQHRAAALASSSRYG